MYATEWPILCWCAVKKLLTHSLTVAAVGRKQKSMEGCTGSGRSTPSKKLSSGPSSPSRSSGKSPSSQSGAPLHSYGKLVVCKRFCQRIGDLTDDPVELRLLYAQAVHYVVHVSYRLFSSEKLCFRLQSSSDKVATRKGRSYYSVDCKYIQLYSSFSDSKKKQNRQQARNGN